MAEQFITLKDCGELAFIESIKPLMNMHSERFERQAGDDCLVTMALSGKSILATTDTFIDTVHFSREFFTFGESGERCMSASVSDIAAMAGAPMFSLVSLAMPQDLRLDDARDLFRGLQTCAERYGCPLAGGETVSTPGPVTVTVTVIGTAQPGKSVKRSGAKAGDSIYLTGTIGDAMAGLMAFQKKIPGFDNIKRKFIAPEARVTLAIELTERFSISSMIDISDGVATDLTHICDESGCGAELNTEALPLSEEYLRFADGRIDDRIGFALGSGEEFELLFTSNDKYISERFAAGNCQITRIGTVTENSGVIELIDNSGVRKQLHAKGYEHFKA